MGEGWLSLLKWLPPLKLSKVGLFWDTYRCTCGPRDLTVLHRRDVGLGIELYTTWSKDVLIILNPLNWALALIPLDRAGVPDLSVSGDNFNLVEDDPHNPTMTTKPEAPMQSLNQLPIVTNLVDARSAWSRRSFPVRNRRTNKKEMRAI
jgi:hypothetical protein